MKEFRKNFIGIWVLLLLHATTLTTVATAAIDEKVIVPKLIELLNASSNIAKESCVSKESALATEKFLSETLFILPDNDGESHRSIEIITTLLKLYNLPLKHHLHKSDQGWGATLDKEAITPEELKRVKRVVIFEMPGKKKEEWLKATRNYGEPKEVIIVDHHYYEREGLDRRRPESSIEQIMSLVHWPMSKTDEAIAVNDRSYIPGLKKMGLSEEEIKRIREYDLLYQSLSKQHGEVSEIKKHIAKVTREAEAIVPKLKVEKGIYILDDDNVGAGEVGQMIRQVLAIKAPASEIASTFEIGLQKGRIGFSGNPKIVQRLIDFDFKSLGYAEGSFVKYGGGDANNSMFFAFKPDRPPKGRSQLIPNDVLEKIKQQVFMEE
ncbi:MAG: hypothetical protein HQK50_07750 [Oligoflexia bacterium]|nr:hypothetical protein [Oligoflexia bacterium]MBF0365450.1 hypothetical protein [Oligoflexia bacterium]